MKLPLAVFVLFPLLMFSQSFEKGEKLFLEGKLSQAQLQLENYLKSNPSNLKTLEYLGDIASHNKVWDSSVDYYKKLTSLNPRQATYFYKYGAALAMKASESNTLKALGMVGELRNSFEKAIELDPKQLEARWALIELYLQLPGIFGGSQSKAIRYSEELKTLSAVDGYLSRGHIEEYFKRYPSAEQQYMQAIKIGHSKICYQKLADLYKNKMMQVDKANAVLEDFNSVKK